MSIAKKRRPYEYAEQDKKESRKGTPDRQESLRNVKIEAERLKEALQQSVIDNPKMAKKAALLISLWMEGKKPSKQKKK